MADTEKYDIIVIGGGHAGIEAALAPARMGLNILLITMNIDTIGQMSCNPSVGGLAKGHLVREIDALGGEMGLLADKTAIQFRMLNLSKGPAVWSPRTQNDRIAYKVEAQKTLAHQKNVDLKQEEAVDFIIENGSAAGIKTKVGNEYRARAVIVTAGTFLNGLMHVGMDATPGGRRGEPPASDLSASLKKAGLVLGRLKTGTSPRIAARSVDLSGLQIQPGDEPPIPFSLRTKSMVINQQPCHITHTNEKTHQLIRDNLNRSPLYGGRISGTGPRYCPSIETKVVRFAERNSHIVFIEPEGIESDECYLNGLSTSLPHDVQVELLHTIPGLERAEIIRSGYAIEYDFLFPIQLRATLETKAIPGLFCAGQLNGTSGYEEAAAQGLIAGINAALKLRGENPFILKRYEAYIGVLIDDLVTKDTREPYRMFTSQAEHRLILRIDNVADRLTGHGVRFGLMGAALYQKVKNESVIIDNMIAQLQTIYVKSELANPILAAKGEPLITGEHGGQSLFQILKRPKIKWSDILNMGNLIIDFSLGNRVEIEVKYEGYIKRENESIKKLGELEKESIPLNINYPTVQGLSNEAKNKLSVVQPANLDQASRVQGIGPADILTLLLHLKKVRIAGPSREHVTINEAPEKKNGIAD